jgi:type IV pilus assembly protein PilC
MAKFTYVALDARGRESQGEIDAENQTAPSFMSRVKPKQLMVFTRQLATLVDAGLPLVRSLEVLEKQEKNPALKHALREMADAIQSGSTFAEALSHHPKIFNKLYVNMAKAGEVGGVLDQVLVRLAEFMEKAQRIKNKVTSAMVYPIVVMVMALGILTFLMIFIIPKFKEIFSELLEGQGLPALTQFVMNISSLMTTRLPFLIAGVVVLVVLFKVMAKTKWGSLLVDRLKLNMPVFGVLVKKTAIGRFTRTLGTLMTSGVPVLQALNIVRDTSGNEVLARAVSQIHDAVKEGDNMAPPIEASKVFPPMVVSMVQVGEETGEVPEMLMKIADTYDDEVDNTVAGLTSVIEPLLIVFLALVVGTIVISLFLPLVSIIGKLS